MLSPEDLAERRHFIGGSDSAKVTGESTFGDRLTVHNDKLEKSEPIPTTKDMRRGNAGEAFCTEEFERETGLTVVAGTPHLRHPRHDFIGYNADGIIPEPFFIDQIPIPVIGDGVFEAKCPKSRVWRKWNLPSSVPGCGIPQMYIQQVHHGMLVTGLKWGVLAYFDMDLWNIAYRYIPEDLEEQERIRLACCEFWRLHIVEGIVPEQTEISDGKFADDGEDTSDIKIDDGEAWAGATQQLGECMAMVKDANLLLAQAKADVISIMGNEKCVQGSGCRCHNKTSTRKGTIDPKLITADGLNPDKYRKPSTESKTFRPYFIKREEE